MIPKKEKISISLIICLLVVLPQIWAYLITPNGYFFNGTNLFSNLNDVEGVYFSAIHQFSKDNWLYKNPFDYSSSRFFHYPVYLLLGKIVGLTKLPLEFIYHTASVILTFVFCLSLFSILKLYFSNKQRGLSAFFLVNFGGLLSIGVPESNAFFSYSFPHFIVAQLALLSLIFYLTKLSTSKKLSYIFGIFISTFILASIHPWMVVPLIISWCLYSVFLFFKNQGGFRTIFVLAILLFVSIPWLIYYKSKIFWTSFRLESNPGLIFLLYGALFLFAILGLVKALRNKENHTFGFLGVWFLVELVFVYLPLPFQRRFVEGLYFPIAVFGLLGIESLPSFIKFKFNKENYLFIFALLSCGVIVSYLAPYLGVPNDFVHKPIAEKKAFEFLDIEANKNSRLLSLPLTGNHIAGKSLVSVFVGHWIQTPDFEKKQQLAIEYFSAKQDLEKRQEFLIKEKICYVYVGPNENRLNKLDFNNEYYLMKVFNNKEVKILKTKWCNT